MMPAQQMKIIDLNLDSVLTTAWQEVVGDERASSLNKVQAEKLQAATGLSQIMLAKALLPIAASYAMTPISHYNVGVIVIDSDDNFFFGANYEREGMPLNLTLHAEQSALFNALSSGCAKLKALVVNAAPCGHCRQFIREFRESALLKLYFDETLFTFDEVLPHSFGPDHLGVKEILESNIEDAQSAKDASNASYAPYSQSQAGMVAKVQGRVVARSWYIENAAFNPSASPLILLLSQLNLLGYRLDDVDEMEWFSSSASLDFLAEVRQFSETHSAIKMTYI